MKNIFIITPVLGVLLLASSAFAQNAFAQGGIAPVSGALTTPTGFTSTQNPDGTYSITQTGSQEVPITVPGGSAAAPSGLNTTALAAYGSGLVFVVNAILLPVVVAIAFITFLWGVYKFFIFGASNETEKGDGRRFVLWGLVGFTVIFSLWGLVNIVAGTFSLPLGGVAPPPPKL